MNDAKQRGQFNVWDRATKAIWGAFPGTIYGGGNYNFLQRAAFSPNGELLIAYSSEHGHDRSLRIWDVPNRRSIGTLNGEHSPVWSPDGRLIATMAPSRALAADASTGFDHTLVHVWEVAHPLPQGDVGEPLTSVIWSPDGRRLATNGMLWNVEAGPTGISCRKIPQPASATCLAFGGDGDVLLADIPERISKDRPIMLTRGRESGNPLPLSLPELPDEQKILTSQNPAQVLREKWHLALDVIDRRLVVSPNGAQLAVVGQLWVESPDFRTAYNLNDWRIVVWPLQQGATWTAPGSRLERVAWSPDGKQVAACGQSYVWLWDSTGKKNSEFSFPRASTNELEGWIAKTSSDGKLFDYYFGTPGLAWHPDGQTIFAGTTDGRIAAAQRAANGAWLGEDWSSRNESVLSLAINPTGHWLAAGSADGSICLWEITSRKELARWQSHEQSVTALEFSPNTNVLVSGSSDGTYKLWDLDEIRKGLARLKLDW
jgi:WD40 repeat protein